MSVRIAQLFYKSDVNQSTQIALVFLGHLFQGTMTPTIINICLSLQELALSLVLSRMIWELAAELALFDTVSLVKCPWFYKWPACFLVHSLYIEAKWHDVAVEAHKVNLLRSCILYLLTWLGAKDQSLSTKTFRRRTYHLILLFYT